MLTISILSVACLALGGVNAAAIDRRDVVSDANIKNIVVFGDSFSDNGNVLKFSGVPRAPYFEGRFSNGPNYVDYLAKSLNGPVVINNAYGGAVADRKLLPDGAKAKNGTFPPDINEQLAAYLANNTVYPDPKTSLYPIFIGVNDYFQTLGAQAIPKPATVATAVIDFIKKLRASPLKVERIVVLQLPDFGQAPAISRSANATGQDKALVQALATSISTQHNALLLKGIEEIRATDAGLHIDTVDLVALIKGIQAIPDKGGFTNFNSPCLTLKAGANVTSPELSRNASNVIVCDKPDEYLYWDNLHPTTHGHRRVAEATFAAVTANLTAGPSSGNETSLQNGAIHARAGTASVFVSAVVASVFLLL
ncbi:hypothetical protein PhCBS80983_g01111 [Powellomyces hirtus]|uniref:SGNH hydrolase-type esterase domain-containing protein n=1 Tax=Powellomyces hirtus TaxID=109895 RepID=A0A507ECF0_9FUNG|nr:hypothetical protein PhCBS80983_g01111 [Powellomyces hirtus]